MSEHHSRIKPRQLWLRDQPVDIHAGFADDHLRDLAIIKEREPWAFPWLYPTTELYSFGKCYREWSGWPRWLPIPLYGDHGVTFRTLLDAHERGSRARVHLTWNHRLSEANRGVRPRVVLIQNPWVTYRRMAGIRPAADRRGTLLFIAHSVPGWGAQRLDPERLRAFAESLPATQRPLVACLHRHDVNAGLQQDLRDAGIPVVTAGNTTSPYFIDRFYDLVRRFEWIKSEAAVGSQDFYCEELGIPPTLLESDLRSPDRQIVLPEELAEKAVSLRAMADETPEDISGMIEHIHATFRRPPDESRAERRRLVEDFLAVDQGISRRAFRWLLVRETLLTGSWTLFRERHRIARDLLRRTRATLKVS